MAEGLGVMVIGMTVVFSFLIIMVIMMYASSWAISKLAPFFPEQKLETSNISEQNRSKIAAIIAIARSQG